MVYESVIALLQKQGYELAEPDSSGWFSTRNLDDFLNGELLENCLLKINSVQNAESLKKPLKLYSESIIPLCLKELSIP